MKMKSERMSKKEENYEDGIDEREADEFET